MPRSKRAQKALDESQKTTPMRKFGIIFREKAPIFIACEGITEKEGKLIIINHKRITGMVASGEWTAYFEETEQDTQTETNSSSE